MRYRYNYEKSSLLLETRGIGFEEIVQAVTEGNLLMIKDHPNKSKYFGQKIMYVRIVQEVYAVPCVEEDTETIFLKTLFPSRKARKEFLK